MTAVDERRRESSDHSWLERVTLSAPDAEGRVLISTIEGPVLRVPGAIGTALAVVQKSPDAEFSDLAASLGVSEQSLRHLVETVGQNPSVAAGGRERLRRVQLRPPFTVQLTLLDPSKVIPANGWLVRALRRRPTWIVLSALNIVGALAVAAQWATPDGPLYGRLSLSSYGWLLVGWLVSMFIHEFAHAATLIAHGGRTRRLGFMLFYLAPAFFCDVRDAWSIDRRDRVRVAVAGVMAQGTVAAVAAVAAFFVPSPWAEVLAFVGFFNIVYWVFNLVPFAKLDGYVALAGHLDRPHLRDQAIAAFHGWLGSAIYGDRHPRPQAGRSPGLTAFGAACVVFPVVLVVGAILSVGSYFGSLGKAALWLELLLAAAVLVWLAIRVQRHVRRTWRSGVSRSRLVATWTVVVIVTVAAMGCLPLPRQVSGGMFVDGDVPVLGFLTPDLPPSIDGAPVVLREQGLVPGPRLLTTHVTGSAYPCEIPLSATVAVERTDLTLHGWCVGVSGSAALRSIMNESATGSATALVSLPVRTVGQRAADIVSGVLR